MTTRMHNFTWLSLLVSVIITVSCGSTEITSVSTLDVTTTPSDKFISSTQILPTRTSTPENLLSDRQPSVEQIKTYLSGSFADTVQQNITFDNECVNDECIVTSKYLFYIPGFGQPANEYLASFFEMNLFLDDDSFYYVDVSGDKQDDLIIHGSDFVIVFLWQGEYYTEPYLVLRQPWKYGSSSQIYFEDWTGDHINEIVFDFRGGTGGTGASGNSWFRHLVHCKDDICQVIWHHPVFTLLNWFYDNGLVYSQTETKLQNDKTNHPSIQTYTKGFDISMSNWNPETYQVYTTTLSTYSWDGVEFALDRTKVITPERMIQAQSTLTSTSITGVVASVSYGVCQLHVEEVVSQKFGCKPNFTIVRWQDITNDDILEVVVTTLSAATSEDVAPSQAVWNEEECLNQRLIAYEWDKGILHEVANIAGCVVQSDLYGVRLEDYDSDGQVEIVAASKLTSSPLTYLDWSEPIMEDRIYKWNGSEFTLWKQIQR